MEEETQIIFVAGVHGVGKGYFCNELAATIKSEHVIASDLIRKRKRVGREKHVANVNDNQLILIDELRNFKTDKHRLLLDGHFCLFGADKLIERIPLGVFKKLNVSSILLLVAPSSLINNRLINREDKKLDITIEEIEKLQASEFKWAQVVASDMGIPIETIEIEDDCIESQVLKAANMISREGLIYEGSTGY